MILVDKKLLWLSEYMIMHIKKLDKKIGLVKGSLRGITKQTSIPKKCTMCNMNSKEKVVKHIDLI